jgi:hypothetical protein
MRMRLKLTLRKRIAGLAVVAAIAFPALGQSKGGQIVGIVRDEKGRPVAKAQVSPRTLGVAVLRALVVTVETDVHGRFRIDHLDWGSYAIYAGKEADSYPNTMYPLYRTKDSPKVTLSEQHPTARAVVTIGPRGGILVGTVRDALTHAPLHSQLVLKKADASAEIMISERPEFRALLPADTNLTIEIRQPGYEPWMYSTPPNHVLRVKSGEQVKVEVNLTPSGREESRPSSQ